MSHDCFYSKDDCEKIADAICNHINVPAQINDICWKNNFSRESLFVLVVILSLRCFNVIVFDVDARVTL